MPGVPEKPADPCGFAAVPGTARTTSGSEMGPSPGYSSNPTRGSGPSVPGRLAGTTRMRNHTLAVMAILLTAVPAAAQRFERVETRVNVQPAGQPPRIFAVADLNDDGRDDLLVGAPHEASGEPEDRFERTTLYEYAGVGNGRFRRAPLVRGTIRARTPVVAVDDFNADGRDDLAVFDAGVYVASLRLGHGNPPQLFLSRPQGGHVRSHALAHAVRREHRREPAYMQSGPADLHVKTTSTGDIDGDGDVDLWIESTGGANVTSHFMVNRGDGTFEIERARAPDALLHNPRPEYWRHQGNDLVDLDNDGDPDLVLGQMRDTDPTHVNQFSIVLVNDGTGHYRSRVELPHPRFARAYTHVPGLTHFDVNDDGFEDLLLLHQRNDEVDVDGWIDWTGRYIQVLINRGDLSFADETRTRMGNQGRSRPQRHPDGSLLHGEATPALHDINRDGCPEIVMTNTWSAISRPTPAAYRNNGRGQFRPLAPETFLPPYAQGYQGHSLMPADVNGDGLVDLVFPDYDLDVGRTALVALVNRTRARPIRCSG